MPDTKKKELDWEGMFRKYIWNANTTPYLTPVSKLNQRQANSEIRFYCWFLIILFGVVALTSLKSDPDSSFVGAPYYGFSVVCAAVLFGFSKIYAAALYLSATPLVSLAYLWLYGVATERPLGDSIIVTLIILGLLRYSIRIVAIAKCYQDLSAPPPAEM